MDDTFSSASQLAQFEQDRNKRSDDSWKWELSDEKKTQCIVITHILVTDIIAGLHSAADVYAVVDIDGISFTKTSNQPGLINGKDTVEWDQEIFLPSDRSSTISFELYASIEIDQVHQDQLLCQCKTTVGELINRNGQLQLQKCSGDSPSRSSLRIILERRVHDVTQDTSSTSVSGQSVSAASENRGLFQKVSSLLNWSKESNTSSLDAKSGPRIFALIVAIDKYKSEKNVDLSGCKRDGERFKNLLTGILGVPSPQIVFLYDENATRDAILFQFNKHFIENQSIEKGDAMVFFYAGHGSQVQAPPSWISEGNKMEAICPHDEKTVDSDKKETYAIHDRTIHGLIRTLASKKGDNIVLIFDSCHSGGASRAPNGLSSLRPRFTSPPSYPPPADLDREIWDIPSEKPTRSAQSAIPIGSYRAMESHILLAACRPNEVALEDPNGPGGLFTSALLNVLERCAFQDTTYGRLFEKLRIRENLQHPQCQGGNKDRLLFSINTLRHGETTFNISQRKDKLYASAGAIHGVVVGTEFTVKSGTQTVLLKAVDVGAFECLLERRHYLNFTFNGAPESAVVSDWYHPTLRVHSSIHRSGTHFTVVPPGEPADIAIRQIGSEWVLERFDPLSLAYSTPCITLTEEMRPTLEALPLVANFLSYLYRADKAGGSFAGQIKIKLQRVEKQGNIMYPIGKDLLDVPSLWQGEMEIKEAIITDFEVEYCITVENYSKVGLFPYLFYFDPSNYSVQAWYLPPSANMLPPLQPGRDDGTPSLFAHGYGGFGTDPIEFYLPEGETVDSGFLKIFLTNAYVDMNTVRQSAINETRLADPPMMFTKGIWESRTFVLTCRAS